MKILIDNGHGVLTPGKRSPGGELREYLYCRQIAAGTVAGLRVKGIDAELLVPEEDDVPLRERCARVNACCARHGAGSVLLVSVHVNAAGSGACWLDARGWEAWTSPGVTSADALAESLYRAAARALPGMTMRRDCSDGDSDKEARFHILTGTRCAAVITENLFMDNRADVEFLLSAEGRDAITRLHVEGIAGYLDNHRP